MMTDQKNKRKKAAAEATPSSENKLNVAVKVGILHPIADDIYGTPARKIREAVANSRDNGASWVVINVDRTTRTISIFDNGSGITKERFQEIFKSIGHPLPLPGPEKKISYFGLGLMSIFQLGNRVKLFTRPRGKPEFNLLEVQTDSVFDPENKDKPISFLKKYVTLKDAGPRDRAVSPAPVLNGFLEGDAIGGLPESLTEIVVEDVAPGDLDEIRAPAIGGFPDSFTEIVIEDVAPGDLDEICASAFEDDLRKTLPLRVEKDEPFLKRFPDSRTRKRITEILHNQDYCRTIDVYFGVEGERGIKQLWKYFPRFRSELRFPKDNVYAGVSQGGDFAYYIVHTIAEDMQRGLSNEERETGFWVRNQNFLVKGAHFLDKPGPGRHVIQKPLRPWIFGEVFHKDMNAFLTVARDDYLYHKPEFKEFRDEVIGLVQHLNEELRSIYQEKDRILTDLVKPFAEIAEPQGAIRRTEEKLQRLMGQGLTDLQFQQKALEELKRLRHPDIEDDTASIEAILTEARRAVVLAEDANALVQVDPRLRGTVQDCQVTWDAAHTRVVVSVSPDLFKPTELVFLGKTFTVVFIAQGQAEPGVSINVDSGRIYVNPFNKDLSVYSISIIDIFVALEIADVISQTKDELKKNLRDLLFGPALPDVAKYIVPLGEDLRRTFRDHVRTH